MSNSIIKEIVDSNNDSILDEYRPCWDCTRIDCDDCPINTTEEDIDDWLDYDEWL